MTKKTLCFVAGKSGGHIVPCLTLAQQFVEKNSNSEILFFSTNLPLDKVILSADKNITHHITLPLSSANPRSFFHCFIIIWQIIHSLCTSFFYLLKHKPSKVVTTGGVVAIPTCIAAYILRIPITIYSLDAVPGKAIKFLAPFTANIMICFKNSRKFFPSQKCSLISFPIRYTQENISLQKQKILADIGVDPYKKTVLILGGSQGSLFLNNCVNAWINSDYFNPTTTQIIHQTGSLDSTDWKNLYKQHNIDAHVFSYQPKLSPLYNASDLIICRAGAGTLFEIQFFKKQCIIIPLKAKTTTHQVDNAQVMSQEYPELFCVIDQDDVTKNESLLFMKINTLLRNI